MRGKKFRKKIISCCEGRGELVTWRQMGKGVEGRDQAVHYTVQIKDTGWLALALKSWTKNVIKICRICRLADLVSFYLNVWTICFLFWGNYTPWYLLPCISLKSWFVTPHSYGNQQLVVWYLECTKDYGWLWLSRYTLARRGFKKKVLIYKILSL